MKSTMTMKFIAAFALFVLFGTGSTAFGHSAKQLVPNVARADACIPHSKETPEIPGFVRFHAPNGCAVWLNADQIIAAYSPDEEIASFVTLTKSQKTAIASAHGKVRLPFGIFYLRETPAQIAEMMPEKRRLTAAGGSDLFIKPDEVFVVSPAADGTSVAGVNAVLRVHDAEFYVRETPYEAALALAKRNLEK